MRQRILLDGMDEASRLTGRGDEVVPTPRCEMATLFVDSGNVRRDRIQASKIIKQPPVQTIRPESALNRRNIKRFGRGGRW